MTTERVTSNLSRDTRFTDQIAQPFFQVHAIMSNLLALPFKKTYPIDIKEPARKYISDYGGAHPDEFKDDIKSWQTLRKEGVGGVVHDNRVDAALL